MAGDKEKAAARRKRWRDAHPDQARECARRGSAKWRAENPELARTASAKWAKKNPEANAKQSRESYWRCFAANPKQSWLRVALAAAKRRARNKNLPFNLRPEDIETPDHCEVLGFALQYARVPGGKKCPGPDSPSLDKLDPALGYVAGNVRVISHRANLVKHNASAEEVERVLSYMRRHLKGVPESEIAVASL